MATDDQLVNANISPFTWTLERFSWGRTGVWLDGLNALPGESVTSKLGIADAEDLAGVQAQVLFGSLGMYSADLGGTVKAIAYTASGDVLSGGKGALFTFTFNASGKGVAKVELTSVKLADAEGGAVACEMAKGRSGGKPGGK